MATKDITDEQVCGAYETYSCARDVYKQSDDYWPYTILEGWTGEPFKVCYAAMERAARRGLIDYGVSLRTGWLTDKGRQLLLDALMIHHRLSGDLLNKRRDDGNST